MNAPDFLSQANTNTNKHFPNVRKTVFTILVLMLLPVSSHAARLERFEFSRPEMGAPFRIVLYAKSGELAEIASQKAFERVEALNQILSDYEVDSELSALSRSSGSGHPRMLSAELWHVLSRAQELARETDGAFDVTVGPLTSLWRKARREHKLPPPEKVAELRQSVGYQFLLLDPKRRSALLKAPRMRLDLGAIAKGYAVDEALRVLRKHGIRRALVAAAGDIAVSDPPPGKAGWEIAVGQHDLLGPSSGDIVSIKNQALSTSGDLYQHIEIEGKRYSHILDPKTGLGLTDHGLVTVVAKDCMTSDSWATTISVMGPNSGILAAEKHAGVATSVITKPHEVVESTMTKRFRKLLRHHSSNSDKPPNEKARVLPSKTRAVK